MILICLLLVFLDVREKLDKMLLKLKIKLLFIKCFYSSCILRLWNGSVVDVIKMFMCLIVKDNLNKLYINKLWNCNWYLYLMYCCY